MKKTIIASFIALTTFNISIAIAQDDQITEQEKELNEILQIIEGRVQERNSDGSIKENTNDEPKTERRRIRIQTVAPREPEKQEEITSQFQTKGGGVDSYDHLYLLNIPIGTKISVNEDFYVPPYRDGIIYKGGNIQSRSPLFDNIQNTFCHFGINESGHVRRFKAEDNNYLTVESNHSTTDEFIDDDGNTLTLYQTTLFFDNQHIENLRCITTEKNIPLNIGDLDRETGQILEFEFPEVVDI